MIQIIKNINNSKISEKHVGILIPSLEFALTQYKLEIEKYEEKHSTLTAAQKEILESYKKEYNNVSKFLDELAAGVFNS